MAQVSRLKTTGAFVVAVIVTYVVGSIASTQSILSNVVDMNVPVAFMDRLAATGHDLLGMAPTYLPIITIGFLIAFGVTKLVLRFLPDLRSVGYVLAGLVAVLAIHLSMEAALTMHPLPTTRTFAGLAMQGIAGAIGGLVFVRMTRQAA